MMNALKLLNYGSYELKLKDIFSHRLDSEILLSKVIGKRREELLVNLDQNIKSDEINLFKNLISRRSLREPIAYIVKEKEFWGKNYIVNKNTLIPRPETELLVESLAKIYKEKSINILDVGTGSGCILLSLLSELKNSHGIGIDISCKAIFYAKKNANMHNIRRAKFFKKSISEVNNQKFDLIVSNPPYIEKIKVKNLDDDIRFYEPLIALDGGNDGLDVIKKVIYKAKKILKVNGTLALEIGNWQYKRVSEILNKNSFRVKKKIIDYKDNIRCLIATS